MKKKSGKSFSYEGRELESMDFAVRYHKWILSIFKPYLGKTVVEIGAGSGSFTELIAEVEPHKLIAVEPSDEMFSLLQDTTKRLDKAGETLALKGFFSQIQTQIKSAKPSAIVYVNVFEHIDDDHKELELLYKALPKGGSVCIFVPANKWLMSDFDRKIGHFRRYQKNELKHKLENAGFEIDLLRRFDAIGIVPWLIKYRLMRSTTMEAGLTRLYDLVVVPIESRLESRLSPVMGKNLVAVATKR